MQHICIFVYILQQFFKTFRSLPFFGKYTHSNEINTHLNLKKSVWQRRDIVGFHMHFKGTFLHFIFTFLPPD